MGFRDGLLEKKNQYLYFMIALGLRLTNLKLNKQFYKKSKYFSFPNTLFRSNKGSLSKRKSMDIIFQKIRLQVRLNMLKIKQIVKAST